MARPVIDMKEGFARWTKQKDQLIQDGPERGVPNRGQPTSESSLAGGHVGPWLNQSNSIPGGVKITGGGESGAVARGVKISTTREERKESRQTKEGGGAGTTAKISHFSCRRRNW